MSESKEELITVEFTCPICEKKHYIYDMPKSKLDRVLNRNKSGEYIQDILEDMSASDREKFLSNFCDECQKILFGDDE